MDTPLKMAFADDQALVRHGLRSVLESFGDLEIVIDAEDGERLLHALQRTRVDIIVTDLRMPKYTGIEVARWLRAHGDQTPIILVTTFEATALLESAAQAGVQGFLLKDSEPEDLHGAIRQVAAGHTLLAPIHVPPHLRDGTFLDVLEDHLQCLTERELSVLRLVACGYSNKEIARVLSIAAGTVKNHMSDIMRKLDARDRTHAVLKAMAKRFI